MTHSLAEPIPGAPDLGSTELQTAELRLRKSIQDFQQYSGELKPHFAYGDLNKAETNEITSRGIYEIC
jgi:hypothetical protein